jgi:hypothetical protein
MPVPPRPWHSSGPCSDNLIAKDHRNSLVLIMRLGHGAIRVGVERETVGFVPPFFQS